MKIAYSYRRFSSPGQKKGDSRRRQDQGALDWCSLNPDYVLDDSLHDDGKGAFRGKNSKSRKCAMNGFLLKIEAGLIKPGSVLLLENLDRLSRQEIDDSLELAKTILKKGIDIVTFLPERRYTAASLNNLAERLELEFTFHRAHEESRMKSERLKERWAQRREKMREGNLIYKRMPFWISVVDGKYVLNEKVAWVRHAMQMALEGHGYVQIVKHFNGNGWKVNRAETVDRHLIRKTLRNRQLIGEHQPRTFSGSTALSERPTDGKAIPGYYPAAIDEALFHRVQAVLDTKTVKGRGRSAGTCNNLFSGLLFDLRDGGKLYQTQKGRCKSGRIHYIASWNASEGKPGAVYISFPYDRFEAAFLKACREISPALLTPPSDVDGEIASLEAAILETALKTERAKVRLENAKDGETEEIITEQLADLRRQSKEQSKKLDELKSQKTSAPTEQMAKLHTFVDMLAATTDADEKDHLRTMIRALIAGLVETIGVWIQKRGHMQRRCFVLVHFKNGLWRKIFVTGKGEVVSIAGDDDKIVVPVGDGWE